MEHQALSLHHHIHVAVESSLVAEEPLDFVEVGSVLVEVVAADAEPDGGIAISVVWALVGGVWLFVLHDSGEGPLLW